MIHGLVLHLSSQSLPALKLLRPSDLAKASAFSRNIQLPMVIFLSVHRLSYFNERSSTAGNSALLFILQFKLGTAV